MAPKRKNDDTENEVSGREKKRLKNDIARAIALQPGSGDSATSTAVVSFNLDSTNSMQGLPSAIDVEKFAEARAWEITSMQNAMKSSSEAATHRVWQALPRHLRRRAASHDVRRVPTRLRERARQEMDPPKKVKHSLPKRGKQNRRSLTEEMLSRQHDKTWLETHVWHSKRMHMENMWGYRLAVCPTEKAFRPSYRAAVHGAILHDASYHAVFELRGAESVIRTILGGCSDPQGVGPSAKRNLTGSRMISKNFYKPGSYPHDLIGPVSVLWCPVGSNPTQAPSTPPRPPNDQPSHQTIEDDSKSRRRRKKKRGVQDPSSDATSSEVIRLVLVLAHPSISEDVSGALQTSASRALSVWNRTHPSDPPVEVELADLSGQFVIFEMFGPKSSQVIQGALTPVDDKREDFTQFWASLKDLQSSGSVPRGMTVGLTAHDPRLNFPPSNAKVNVPHSEKPTLRPTFPSFPSAALAASKLWDSQIRASLSRPRYKKSEIDDRRSKMLIPGSSLLPLQHDDRIPVLLIQHSAEIPESDTRRVNPALHGWLLIMPAGWGMPFLSSLLHTGTRVAGQRERSTQAFEAGLPYFPRDFPTTRAYSTAEDEKAKALKETWEKKPPAKRPNWDVIGTRTPYKCDWEVVLGSKTDGATDDLVPAQRTSDQRNTISPWLLCGTELPSIIQRLLAASDECAELASIVKSLQEKQGKMTEVPTSSCDDMDADSQSLPVIPPDTLVCAALVRVRIQPCLRGSLGDLAMLYGLDSEEEARWRKIIDSRRSKRLNDSEETTTELEALERWEPTQSSSIIGYITTGSYSLARGEGSALGAVPLIWYLRSLKRLASGDTTERILAKARDRDGTICRSVYVDLLPA